MELMKRGSGYILKVESTRICYGLDVRVGKVKSRISKAFWFEQLKKGWVSV